MSCDNLCTAAKCKELENRISALEQALELLEASFEAHTNQDIPQAHNYKPTIDVTASFVNDFLTIGVTVDNAHDIALVRLPKYEPEVDVSLAVDSASNSLKVFVAVGDKNDSDTITLPKYEPEVNVSLAVDNASNSLKVFVAVGDKNDSETITLPKLPVNVTADINDNYLLIGVTVGDSHDIDGLTLPESNLRLDGSFQSDTLTLTVADGQSQDTATISIPLPEIPAQPEVEQHVKSNLRLSGSFQSDTLTLSVADGESQDTATISIPLPEIPAQPEAEQHVKSNLRLSGSFQSDILTLSVADGESQDTATISIPLPEIPEAEQHVKSNLRLNGSYQNDDLTLTVADGESQDTITINIPTPNHGGGGISPEGCGIDLAYENNLLTVNLTVGQCSSSDSTKIMEFSLIDVEEITCKDGVAESEFVSVAVIKGTEAAELEAFKARAAIQKAQCELEPVVAAPDWWQVRLGSDRPQIVCVFRKKDSRTYHSLSIPHPADVEMPTGEILPAYKKGNWQGMIVLKDNSKFIVNCISAGEAERICAIAASKIIGSYLPNPYKVWITERKGEPVGESQMKPSSILYFPQGQKNLKPDWRFAIPPDLEPS